MTLLLTLLLVITPTWVTDSLRAVADRCEAAYLANRAEQMPPLMEQMEGWIGRMDPSDSLLIQYHKAHLEKLHGSYYFCRSEENLALLDLARNSYLAARRRYPDRLDASVAAQQTLSLELAQLYYRQKDYGMALEELGPLVNRSFSRSMQQEALGPYAICLARLGRFEAALKAIGRLPAGDPEILRKEAKIRALQAEAAAQRPDEAARLYKQYFQSVLSEWPERLSAMTPEDREAFWMRMRPFAADCLRTEDADPSFLYNVVLFTKELMFQLRTKGRFSPCTWQEVQKALGPQEAAVEFVQYERGGLQHMGALVLRQKGKPAFVHLGTLTSIIDRLLAPDATIGGMLSREDFRLVNRVYDSDGVGKLIWTDALRLLLDGCKDVYFSPDGFLHVVAVEYCYPSEPAPVLHRVSGTRQLIGRRSYRPGRALVMGDVDFDAAGEATGEANDDEAYRCLTVGRLRFAALPHTREEVDTVSAILGGEVVLLRGREATEGALQRCAQEASLIHLSTHGYYAGVRYFSGDEWKPARVDHSLSRSVLLLAGGNRHIHEPSFDAAARQDGLLSAREVSRLSLDGQPMVVLAACQSALGVVTADGISGMQAGWKMAGAGTLLASLWSVSDEATAFFMQEFYRHLAGGCTPREAFGRARERLLEPVPVEVFRYDKVRLRYVRDVVLKDWSAPQFRNAFIMIDD